MTPPTNKPPGDRRRAVAYYRHSLEDRQEDSLRIQRDQIRKWAVKNGVEIIQEFSDAGKSGLTSEDRPAFAQMMDEWVKQRTDFTYKDQIESRRYHALNLTNLVSGRKHTVEFRVFSGSMNATKVAGWVQVCLGLVERALAAKRKPSWSPKPPAAAGRRLAPVRARPNG